MIIFVPAGGTGLFQPYGIEVQLPVKHSLKRSAHKDVVNKVLHQLEAGISVQTVIIDSGIKVMQN
jgi:hypothetical protein